MKSVSLTVLLAAILPFASLAQNNYECANGDLKRRIEIVHETGAAVPCEVHYFKDTEAPGEHQVLWRAMSEEGYCEQKTWEFVAQLALWGWTCGHQGTDAASDEAAEADAADDAEAMAPAEESAASEES